MNKSTWTYYNDLPREILAEGEVMLSLRRVRSDLVTPTSDMVVTMKLSHKEIASLKKFLNKLTLSE